ncbi:MAG TPA: glycosyltransferase [Microthrixaceae bacterium]|mgnify:CR=1 FL=1|jgi:glycosyltransferase involved in cell wall biosynthesis|nr:glycosyltransferase [Microthrixaceae bacterium]
MPASTSEGPPTHEHPPHAGTRVVVVAHGPPLRGGVTTVALDLVEDPVLNAEFEVVFQNTTQAQDKRGRFALENVWRAVSDAAGTFRLARRGAVVHTHSVQDPTLVAWRQVLIAAAARLRGARVLLHNHAFRPYMAPPGGYRVGRAHRWAFALLDRLAEANVVLSSAGIPNLAPLMPRTPMPVVANSVVVEDVQQSSADHEVPVLLFVGELLERKGVLVLLDALDRLRERVEGKWEVRIVGDTTAGVDPEKDRVIREVRARGYGDALTGGLPREEVYRHLAESDVFVFPTFVEGQPFSVIESLAAGVPIVGSDIPTVADMVTDGVHGRLVPPGDADALAGALEELLGDPAARRRMGAACRELALERFDRQVFRRRIAALYRSPGGSPDHA